MAIPTFPSPPPAPNRSTDTQEQFDAKAEAWANWISNTFGPDLDDFAAQLIAEATSFYNAVSATSLTLAAGEKTANIGAGKAFKPGQNIVFADMANPTTKRMAGPIASYNMATGALTFVAQAVTGSGTVGNWMVTVGGEQGIQGIQGDDGPVGPPPAATATSTSTNTISAGTKTFEIPTGVAFAPGSIIIAADAANPSANFLVGQVTAYAGTTLTLSVPAGGTGGAGTISNWSLSLSGPRGPVGPASGWEQIGSPLSTASGNVWTFEPLPAAYSDLHFTIAGMSHTGGTQPDLMVDLNIGGGWALNYIKLAISVSNTFHVTSSLFVLDFNSNNPGVNLPVEALFSWFNASGGLKGIRFHWSGNEAGDAGTITMRGR